MPKVLRIMIPLVSALFFSLSFQLPALPQTPNGQDLEDDQIEIPFGWSVGDRRQYSVKQIDYKNGTAKPTKESIFTVEVISANEQISIAKCNISVVMAPNQRAIVVSTPAAKRMIDLYRDLDIFVRLGNDGTFQGFENEDEIEMVFKNNVDLAKEALEDTFDEMNFDDEKRAFLDRVVKESTNFDAFKSRLLAPLKLMLMVTATTHSKTEVDRRNSTRELVAGHDVPTVEEYRVEDFDSDEKIATVVYSEIAEGEFAAKLLKDEIEAIARRIDPGSRETVEIMGIIYKTNGKFEMNYEDGWPRKIEWNVMMNDFKTGNLEDKRLIHIASIDSSVDSQETK